MVAKKPRILIIGAGMAGLTAAHKLHAVSPNLFDLSIVEAGHRLGGRILTSHFAGDRIEIGATWIHGIVGSPVFEIARTIDALVPDHRPWERMDGFPQNPITVSETHPAAAVDPSLVARISALYSTLTDSARSGRAHKSDGPGVGSFLKRGLTAYRASRGHQTAVTDEEDAVFAIHESVERTYTSADDLDSLDLEAEREYREFPGEQITIAKGYSRVIEHIAAGLPSGTVRFGRKAKLIEWSTAGPVRVHFADGAVESADHVIVTVSLGVLKAGGLVFSPELPVFKKDAIGRLGFGVVNKLFIEMDGGDEEVPFAFPFLQLAWDQRKEAGGHVAGIPRWMRRTASFCPIYSGSRVVLAWFAGEEAVELEKLDDEEIARGVHATMEGFGGKLSRRCSGRVARVKRSGWARDPLFLGSYSYVAVGSSGDDLDSMAEPLPCRREYTECGCEAATAPLQVLFAGEATHRTHYSTTHGAYFSGIREAERLLKHYHLDYN